MKGYLLTTLATTLASIILNAACVPPEQPAPEPPKPPKPPVSTERTLVGRTLDDYGRALDLAADSVHLTYYLEYENDLQIDSAALHQLGDYAARDVTRANLALRNKNNHGIYAPDDKTHYIFSVWRRSGWPIKENPNNGATPITTVMDYESFQKAGQMVVREMEAEKHIINIDEYMAGNFSATVDSVLTLLNENTKTEWRQNGRSVTMDDRTLGLINRPDSRIQTDEPLKIKELFITTGQYAIGDTLLRTDMHVRNSTAMGVKPKISLYHEPADDFYVDIVVAHKKKNTVAVDVLYRESDTEFELKRTTFITILPDALPFDYPIKYTFEDGRQVNGYYGLDAGKHALMLDDKTNKLISDLDNPNVNCNKIWQNFADKQVLITNTFLSTPYFGFWTPKQQAEFDYLQGVEPVGPYIPGEVK